MVDSSLLQYQIFRFLHEIASNEQIQSINSLNKVTQAILDMTYLSQNNLTGIKPAISSTEVL